MQIANQSTTTSPFRATPPPAAFAANATSGTNSSASGSNPGTVNATVTANDFLQLLVTELQNQDPTANTDPNEYVNQLVQVNTLQQQIQMNQTLDGGPSLSGASTGVLQQLEQMNQTLSGDVSSTGASAGVRQASSSTAPLVQAPAKLNASTEANQQAAAEAVATALTPKAGSTSQMMPTDVYEQIAARLKAGGQIK